MEMKGDICRLVGQAQTQKVYGLVELIGDEVLPRYSVNTFQVELSLFIVH